MIIDFHTHMFPDFLAESTIAYLSEKAGIKPHTGGTLKDTILKMDDANIDISVVCNIATNPNQMKNVNDFAIKQNENERLIGFGSIHPDADYAYELERLKENGIKGIKLHPEYQNFFVDDKKMIKVYENILKRNFILIFHAGVDYGFEPPFHATPQRFANILPMINGEKVVLAHMGSFDMWEDSIKYILGNDIYIDTSCAHSFADKSIILNILNAHKMDKILFATDTPWNDMKLEIESTKNLGLDAEFTNMIFYKNAKKLLNI